jgi:NADPH-dependent 7-cyano-7-deazaguanine reductase QueF
MFRRRHVSQEHLANEIFEEIMAAARPRTLEVELTSNRFRRFAAVVVRRGGRSIS